MNYCKRRTRICNQPTFDTLFIVEELEQVSETIHYPLTTENNMPATQHRDYALDLAKFELLWPKAYPYYSKIPLITKFMKKLVRDKIIEPGHLFEKALATQLGLVRESTTGRDFTNGDDAKLVAVRTCSYGMTYSAPVHNTHAKRNNLLVAVYERKQHNWFFFKIPYSAYKHVSKSSNIEIPFELDGTPRRVNRQVVNYWEYEVSSFKDMAAK
jgi:hypothetical protein